MGRLLLVIVVLGCLAGGAYQFGLIGGDPAPSAPVAAPQTAPVPVPALPPPVVARASYVPPSEQDHGTDAKPIDPRLAKQRFERIAAAERGVGVISRDLADRQAQIAKAEVWLADMKQRKVFEAAQARVRRAAPGSTEQDSANVALRNLLATIQERQQELARDREVAGEIAKRLAAAEAALVTAKAAP